MQIGFVILAFVSSLVFNCKAQQIISKSLGGSNHDEGKQIIFDNSNGFYICGGTNSNNGDFGCNLGSFDGFLTHLDSSLNIQWSRCYGGMQSDGFYTMALTDNGFLLGGGSGSTNSGCSSGNSDFWVTYINSTLNVNWQHCFGGSGNDELIKILPTSDGNFILAGNSNSIDGDITDNHGDNDIWLIKIDSTANVIWSKTYGGPSYELFYDIIENNSHNYVICGNTSADGGQVSGTHGFFDYWVVMIDSAGNVIWQRPCGGSSNESAYALCNDSHDNVYVTGEAFSTDGDVQVNYGGSDAWLVKLDSSGNLIQQRSFGGNSGDQGWSMGITNDDLIYFLGYSSSTNGDIIVNHNMDFWIMKLDTNLNIISSNSYGGTEQDHPSNLCIINDSMCAAIGYTVSTDGDVQGFHPGNTCFGYVNCPDVWVVKYSDGFLNSFNTIENIHALRCIINISNSSLDLFYSGEIKDGNYQVELYNSSGAIFLQSQTYFSDSKSHLILSKTLPIGSYYVKLINTKKETYYAKVTFMQ